MKQKTPMQELFEILEQDQYCGSKSNFAKSFLEKEKQQIIDSCNAGLSGIPRRAEQYYQETFGDSNQAGI